MKFISKEISANSPAITYLLTLIANVPVILFIFPLIPGLGFTGSLGLAVFVSTIFASVAAAVFVSVSLFVFLTWIVNDKDSGTKVLAHIAPAYCLSFVFLLYGMNDQFDLHVQSIVAAVIGALVLIGVSCACATLVHFAGAASADQTD